MIMLMAKGQAHNCGDLGGIEQWHSVRAFKVSTEYPKIFRKIKDSVMFS